MRHALIDAPRIQKWLELVFGQVRMLLPHGLKERQDRWVYNQLSLAMWSRARGNQGSQVLSRCEKSLPPAKYGGTGYLGKCIMERLPPVLGEDVQGMEPELRLLRCSESEGCLKTVHEDTIRGMREFGKTIPDVMKIRRHGLLQSLKCIVT